MELHALDWRRERPGPLRADGGVHLWRVALAPPEPVAADLYGCLAPEERARAARFRRPGAGRRYAVCHGALRRILAAYLEADPAELAFAADAAGKPALAGPAAAGDLSFNLSHSADLALVAVARGRALGVDLERLRPRPGLDEIAALYFAPAERADLARVAGGEAALAFFQAWTRKEAFVKALGCGFARPLASFAVTLLPGEPASLRWSAADPEEPGRWSLASLRPEAGYVGALAVPGALGEVSGWTFVAARSGAAP